MKADRELHEEQVKKYEGRLRELNSYVTELKARAAEQGTDAALFEEDLMEAEQNIQFYGDEVARAKEQLKKEAGGGTFWVYRDAAGEWRWHLRMANGRIVADSGEGYHHKDDCLHGIALVKDSRDAPVKEKQ